MKFGEIFEYHKIPEWYNMYLNYELFKQKIELFSMKKKFNEVMKLPGYYIRMDDGELVHLDLTVTNKQDANEIALQVPEVSLEKVYGPFEKSIEKLIEKPERVVLVSDSSLIN